MKFDQYYISADIKKNLRRMGFKRPTDIQFKSIPSILNGEDVLAAAQTGTGKTAAFAIPVIDKIHRFKSSKRSYGIKCIVMVPTRELALQLGGVFRSLAAHTKVKVFAVHGGVEQDAQIAKIQDGIDVLIATPGRMFDLIHQKVIDVSRVTTLVLDEADQMLDLGFIEDIKYIKKMLKRAHQTLFFSATMSDEIKKLAYSQVKSAAIRIQVSPEDKVTKQVTHAVAFMEMDDKRFFLADFLKQHGDDKVMVFVRTQVRAERVVKAMQRVGLEAIGCIHGGKEQHERKQVMHDFRDGALRVLVATDISARGIDIPNIAYVINYDLPEKEAYYVHRIGRTGRGMNTGEAVSLCSPEEKEQLAAIETLLQKPIEVMPWQRSTQEETKQTAEASLSGLRAMVASEPSKRKKRKKS